MNRVQSLRAHLENLKGQRDFLQKSIENLAHEVKKGKKQLSYYEEAIEIVKQVGLATQKQLEFHLSEQVSMAMEAVFDDPYKLKVNFHEKRGKTEVELLFVRDELEFPPLGNAGGGAIDVAALALQIAYWSMRRDKQVRPILLLDEPFSRLKGEDANRRALMMITQISHKLGVQVIMVSDERVPREDILENSDKVFEVVKTAGKSSVKTIKEENISASTGTLE